MNTIKMIHGRYYLLDDKGNKIRQLTHTEVLRYRREATSQQRKIGYKGNISRVKGGRRMEVLQKTNGYKAAEAMRNIQNIFSKLSINKESQNKTIYEEKNEK
jgi:hypothetical protein